jgi:hypothetical protein
MSMPVVEFEPTIPVFQLAKILRALEWAGEKERKLGFYIIDDFSLKILKSSDLDTYIQEREGTIL